MQTTRSVTVPAPRRAVFDFVERLDAYPSWLRLVHEVVALGDDPLPTWEVELRARVGPFARSKRLRMQRVEVVPDQLAVFERCEVDGRQHARWAMRAELAHGGTAPAESTLLTMHLAYDGALWTGGLLDRVLDDEVRKASRALVELVSAPRR